MSDSDGSDPAFEPSRSPSLDTSPQPESSAQAQNRAVHRTTLSTVASDSRQRQKKVTSLRSKPTSGSERSRSSPRKQSSSQDEASQDQQHHLGPFTSSPVQVPVRNLPFHPNTVASPRENSSLRVSHSHPQQVPLKGSFISPSAQPASQLPSDSPGTARIRLPSDLPPHRPNRFYGPPSTYRSWTEQERLVVQSLEQARAKDLSIHLYNAHVLKRRAEVVRLQSGSRSRTRSQNRSTSRARSKSKAKGKARAGSHDEDDDTLAALARSSPDPDVSDRNRHRGETTFHPPPLWTAWPLPPNEVPREEFLPSTLLNGGYRSKRDTRPSAELEECLIATMTRFARQKWEARQWESDDEQEESSDQEDTDSRPRKRKRGSDDRLPKSDTLMLNSNDSSPQADLDMASSQPDSNSSTPDPDMPTFSSQMFTTVPSDSSSESSASTTSSRSRSRSRSRSPPRPVFSADDDHIRALLLPQTRHILSQLHNLLRALHIMQASRRKRKRGDVGERGPEEILGLAELCFGEVVARRVRERWERLMQE